MQSEGNPNPISKFIRLSHAFFPELHVNSMYLLRVLIGSLNYKQLLDEVFVISGIMKVEVSVISRSRRLRLITLTETLIIPDITKTESNNCFIIHCFEENNDKRIIVAITVYFQTLKNVQLSDKQIFTVFKCISFVDLLVFSESLSLSNFSISCWVDEANREAILTSLSVNLTLLLEIMHCARNLQIICRYRLVNNL